VSPHDRTALKREEDEGMTFAEMLGMQKEIRTLINTALHQRRLIRESDLVRTLWAAHPECAPAFISILVDQCLEQYDPARRLPETAEEAGALMRHRYNELEGLTSPEEKVATPAVAKARELEEKRKTMKRH
jgi:hypothetical protein